MCVLGANSIWKIKLFSNVIELAQEPINKISFRKEAPISRGLSHLSSFQKEAAAAVSQCIRCVDALIFYLISWHIISLHTAKSLLILDGLSFSWLHCVTEMLQVKFRGKEERKKEKRDHKTCRPVGQTLRHTHPTRKQSNFGQSVFL